jgi:phosphoribosyl-AMP cyclohydrolase
MGMSDQWLDEIRWNADGLVPVIVQAAVSGKVLMCGWMNREALAETVSGGQAVYWSRSRQRLWRKGESSGHFQMVKGIRLDCDRDTLLLKVEQQGEIACHTGRASCFFSELQRDRWIEIEPVLKDPKSIYA